MTTASDQDDFDDVSETASTPSEFARMLEDSFKSPPRKFAVGDKVKGEVLVAGKEDVYVSLGQGGGSRNEGVVPRRDVVDAEGKLTVKVGDTLDLYVTQVKGAEIQLSTSPTSKNISDDLEDAHDMMLPVEGRVSEVVKGGVRVTLAGGKVGFCPISQLHSSRVETGEEFIGQKLEFHITKFEGGRNIVLSRRRLLDEQKGLAAGAFLETHHEGELMRGRVTRLEPFGAFVEIEPGIEGMVHVSEIAWSRIGHPNEVVTVGQEVPVKILRMEQQEEGRLKLSLSIKQAGTEPWANLPPEIQAGATVPGKVTRCVKFGAFVELAPGVEGLIPMGEMSYTKRVMRSDEIVKEGEKIVVRIKDLDPGLRRISLSLRDAGEDPWALASQKWPVGAIVQGVVDRKEPYGLFIRLQEGVTALLHRSQAADRPEFPFEKLRVGDAATVQIGELRPEERRISLTVPRDAGEADWKGYEAAQAPASASLGTLGGAFGSALQKAMEKSAKKAGK